MYSNQSASSWQSPLSSSTRQFSLPRSPAPSRCQAPTRTCRSPDVRINRSVCRSSSPSIGHDRIRQLAVDQHVVVGSAAVSGLANGARRVLIHRNRLEASPLSSLELRTEGPRWKRSSFLTGRIGRTPSSVCRRNCRCTSPSHAGSCQRPPWSACTASPSWPVDVRPGTVHALAPRDHCHSGRPRRPRPTSLRPSGSCQPAAGLVNVTFPGSSTSSQSPQRPACRRSPHRHLVDVVSRSRDCPARRQLHHPSLSEGFLEVGRLLEGQHAAVEDTISKSSASSPSRDHTMAPSPASGSVALNITTGSIPFSS